MPNLKATMLLPQAEKSQYPLAYQAIANKNKTPLERGEQARKQRQANGV